MSVALSLTLRSTLVAAAAVATSGCANETVGRGGAGQMMMLSGGPANKNMASVAAETGSVTSTIADDISRKSFAAKVLASRALESVTGLKTDPARLSEHD